MEQQNAQTQAAESVAVSEQIFPVTHEIEVEGPTPGAPRMVTVHKIKMKHNAFMLVLLAKIADELGVGEGGTITIPLSDPVALLKLIAKFPDDVNAFCATLSSLTLEEVGELDDADGIRLIQKIIEVNKSFFIERVAPLIAPLMRGMQQSAAAETIGGDRVRRTRKS